MDSRNSDSMDMVVGEWGGLFRSPSDVPQEAATRAHSPTPGEVAQAVFRARRVREEVFTDASTLFADPAWDILLALFIAQEAGHRVPVNKARAASGVPPTTALRWISILARSGLIKRSADTADKRRGFLSLTKRGDTKMRQWLAKVPGGFLAATA